MTGLVVQPERHPGDLDEYQEASRSTIRGCGARMHLALDRPTLIEAIKDVAPMQVGGFIYPFSEFATPKAELVKRIGYQDDPAAAEKEAKALMAAAGHPNGIKGLDFPGPRSRPAIKLWSQAIQAMLQQTLNITAICATWSNRCGSTTSRTGISTWRSARWCRRCWIRRTTSMPGTAPAGRRTTRSGSNAEVRCAGRSDRPRESIPRSARR